MPPCTRGPSNYLTSSNLSQGLESSTIVGFRGAPYAIMQATSSATAGIRLFMVKFTSAGYMSIVDGPKSTTAVGDWDQTIGPGIQDTQDCEVSSTLAVIINGSNEIIGVVRDGDTFSTLPRYDGDLEFTGPFFASVCRVDDTHIAVSHQGPGSDFGISVFEVTDQVTHKDYVQYNTVWEEQDVVLLNMNPYIVAIEFIPYNAYSFHVARVEDDFSLTLVSPTNPWESTYGVGTPGSTQLNSDAVPVYPEGPPATDGIRYIVFPAFNGNLQDDFPEAVLGTGQGGVHIFQLVDEELSFVRTEVFPTVFHDRYDLVAEPVFCHYDDNSDTFLYVQHYTYTTEATGDIWLGVRIVRFSIDSSGEVHIVCTNEWRDFDVSPNFLPSMAYVGNGKFAFAIESFDNDDFSDKHLVFLIPVGILEVGPSNAQVRVVGQRWQ